MNVDKTWEYKMYLTSSQSNTSLNNERTHFADQIGEV